jgi:hypothetical protein
VLSDLVQRDVQIFGGCAVESQNNVIPHAQTLIARLAAPVAQDRVQGSAADRAWHARTPGRADERSSRHAHSACVGRVHVLCGLDRVEDWWAIGPGDLRDVWRGCSTFDEFQRSRVFMHIHRPRANLEAP